MKATAGQVRQALRDFDNLHRNSPEWSSWVDNQAYKYAIFDGGKIYPVKQIVSMATGLARRDFSGGDESNDFLSGLGFKIITLRVASWVIKSGNIAIKTLDKSAFTKGIVIPIEIRDFFLDGNLQKGEHRPVTLMLNGKAYDFCIAMGNNTSKLTRLFWSTDFTAELAQRFPIHFKSIQQVNELEGVPPAEMIFTRESGFERYAISLAEGVVQGDEWTDEELEEAVKAYLWMLEQEIAGKPYSKSDVNKTLRAGKLSKRTKASIEYRMQNISSVLEGFCMARIQGYLPAKNVGSNTRIKIENMLERLGAYVPEDYTPTSDHETLDNRASKILRKGLKGTPKGQQTPQQTTTSTTSFVRDPLVKAWVLENAKGICEGCTSPAPFLKVDGEPFLEVHHVIALSDGGSDTIENAVALCPNCHRRCHVSVDRSVFSIGLYAKLHRLRQ